MASLQRQRVVRVGDGAIAVGLGRAVDGAELGGAQRLDGERDVLRRTDGEAGAHRAQPAPGMIRMLQQGARHVGHAVVHAAALALDQGQRRARLERLLQHHATAMGHDRGHRVGRAERPEQRHRQPQPILGREMLPLADVEAVGQQGPVRQRHALGRGGGARGVEDEADVVRCDRSLRLRQRRAIDAGAARQELRRAEGAGRRIAVQHDDARQVRQRRALQGAGRAACQLRAELAQRLQEVAVAEPAQHDQRPARRNAPAHRRARAGC